MITTRPFTATVMAHVDVDAAKLQKMSQHLRPTNAAMPAAAAIQQNIQIRLPCTAAGIESFANHVLGGFQRDNG